MALNGAQLVLAEWLGGRDGVDQLALGGQTRALHLDDPPSHECGVGTGLQGRPVLDEAVAAELRGPPTASILEVFWIAESPSWRSGG